VTADLHRAISTTLMPGFDGPVAPHWLLEALADGLGSVCLFDTNVVDPDQVRALTSALHAANPRVLIALDEEGGDVTRLHHRGGSPHPSASYLGALNSPEVTREVAAHLGAELRAVGVDLNLAPVADVNTNPLNPVIGVRSYGGDPRLVAEHVAAFADGLQAVGVAACAKHFPGHGDTSADSHRELPTLDLDLDDLRARELVPFRAAVDAGTWAVMTSHILVPAIDSQWPATLSGPILRVLREELGFTGVIVSDALDMAGASQGRGVAEAAVLALQAGVNLLCIGSGNTGNQLIGIRDHIAAAVEWGHLDAARVFDAAAKVNRLVDLIARARNVPPPVCPLPSLDADVFERRGPVPRLDAPLFLLLDTPFNIAAGRTPWGINELLASEVSRSLPGSTFATASTVAELEAIIAIHPDTAIVAQGKDFHRVEFLTESAALLRRSHANTVLVEEGWATPDGYPDVDIVTFGSGRATMLSLIKLLAAGAN
jgi:beta-N-acetylhexosaminidase